MNGKAKKNVVYRGGSLRGLEMTNVYKAGAIIAICYDRFERAENKTGIFHRYEIVEAQYAPEDGGQYLAELAAIAMHMPPLENVARKWRLKLRHIASNVTLSDWVTIYLYDHQIVTE